MSEKLSEIEARVATARQLEAVITAMRGIAAARSREAQARLPGIRASAATVGAAIGDALSIVPGEPMRGSGDSDARGARARHLVIVLSAEQGFVGSFNEQIIERAMQHLDGGPEPSCEFLVAGTRGAMLAEERRLPVVWSAPMVSHVDDVARFASRITDALYERLEAVDTAGLTRVSLIHAVPGTASRHELVEHRLLPFDYGRFETEPRALPPLSTLAPARLLAGLAQQYVFVELCEAAMLSFAAENEARVRAMIAARSNVRTKLDELSGRYRRVRQDEITSDILELAAGAASAL
jgi:F-type H+-transporting ATPase subunit gamma